MGAEIFYRKGQTVEQTETERLQIALERGPTGQLTFLFELIQLSRLLQDQKQFEEKMSLFQEEIIQFFAALAENEVDYLLVGGFAVNVHGFSRATGDLDLWIKDTKENRKRLADAAASTGIAGAEQLATMEWVPGWTGFRLQHGFEVEIMSFITGFAPEDFDACRQRSKIIHFKDIPISVLSLEDLIRAKKQLSRPKDQEDLQQLQRIRKMKDK